MIYNAKSVVALSDRSLDQARATLQGLEVAEGRVPRFSGLHGWVFEQTIEHCLRQELAGLGHATNDIEEQATLGSRAKVDLRVGPTAIEIKRCGLFGDADLDRYAAYRELATTKGWRYVYLTGSESYDRYRTGIANALGPENVFILDRTESDWERFIEVVVSGLTEWNGRTG